MIHSLETSILYSLDDMNIDCKNCFERIREELKTKKNLTTYFRITRFDSLELCEPLEKVCLTNKFSEAICDRYYKSVQINTQHEGAFLFGCVDVPHDNHLTYSCIPKIYLIKFDRVFYIRETKYTGFYETLHTGLDKENHICFDILICCKEKTKYFHYERKYNDFFLANESFALNGSL
jgi:hypothetical protein